MSSLHRERTHPEYVEGCFACKIGSIGVGSVPGGTRPGSIAADHIRKRHRALNEYASARKAGLRPDSTKLGAVEAREKKIESFERGMEKLRSMGNDTSNLKTLPELGGTG